MMWDLRLAISQPALRHWPLASLRAWAAALRQQRQR